jgi:hypothetical protein
LPPLPPAAARLLVVLFHRLVCAERGVRIPSHVFIPANQFVLAGFEAFQPTQTAVPEPSSLLLLSGGLLGLGMVLRTRRA